jgi:hypothetical protein
MFTGQALEQRPQRLHLDLSIDIRLMSSSRIPVFVSHHLIFETINPLYRALPEFHVPSSFRHQDQAVYQLETG